MARDERHRRRPAPLKVKCRTPGEWKEARALLRVYWKSSASWTIPGLAAELGSLESLYAAPAASSCC